MSEQSPSAPVQTPGTQTARRPWIAPELRTMRAGSAEGGPNPNTNEGPFAQGS